MKVVAQEAERRPRERPGQRRVQPRLLAGVGDAEKEGGDRPDPRGDAVHVVEQVEGVRQGDEPEEREHDVGGVPGQHLEHPAQTQQRHSRQELSTNLSWARRLTMSSSSPTRNMSAELTPTPSALPVTALPTVP